MSSRKNQIEEMLKADPQDPFLRYALAMEYGGEGDDEGATQQFQALLADAPDYVPAYHQCGQAFVRLGKITEASQVLRRGMEVARQKGEEHTAEEMEALLLSLG